VAFVEVENDAEKSRRASVIHNESE